MKEIGAEDVKPLNPTRDAVRIVRGVLGGGDFSYQGKAFSAQPYRRYPMMRKRPRGSVPIYVAGTGPRMQQLRGRGGRRPADRRASRPRGSSATHARTCARAPSQRAATPISSTSAARSSRRSTTTATPDARGAREIAGMYLANKVQNIQGCGRRAARAGRRSAQDEIAADRRCDGVAAAGSPPRPRSATRSSTRLRADRRHSERLHRGDRGVRGRRLHAHHARAVGRSARPPDPAVRRRGPPSLPTMTLATDPELVERLIQCVDEARLVETACAYVDTPSPTGSEQAMAETRARRARGRWASLSAGRRSRRADRTWSGALEGAGGGATLMFNGHMDTSYSGREPHLRGDRRLPAAARSCATDASTASGSRT